MVENEAVMQRNLYWLYQREAVIQTYTDSTRERLLVKPILTPPERGCYSNLYW
jgi:hypothetical protein